MTTKPELKRRKPRVQLYVATEDDTFRSVTTLEVVAALIAEGGEIVEAERARNEHGVLENVAYVKKSGRWLLYGPIPVESAEAKETP